MSTPKTDHRIGSCPCCGGAAYYQVGLNSFNDVEIVCSVCGLNSGCYDTHGDATDQIGAIAAQQLNLKAATAAWNKRPDPGYTAKDVLDFLDPEHAAELHTLLASGARAGAYKIRGKIEDIIKFEEDDNGPA